MYRSLFTVFLTAITVWLCTKYPNAAVDSQTGMIMALPDEIPNHKAYPLEISEQERFWLPSDTGMLKRGYYPAHASTKEEAVARSISVTLIQSGADQRSLHRPEVCLDGQGWDIIDQPVVALKIRGNTLKVKDLHLERRVIQPDATDKIVRAHYIYWWVGSQVSTPDTAKRALISLRENILHNRNTRWGYPSIMGFVDEERGETREQTQKRLYEFIESYGATFLKEYS